MQKAILLIFDTLCSLCPKILQAESSNAQSDSSPRKHCLSFNTLTLAKTKKYDMQESALFNKVIMRWPGQLQENRRTCDCKKESYHQMYSMAPLKNKSAYRPMQIFPIWRDRGNKNRKKGKRKNSGRSLTSLSHTCLYSYIVRKGKVLQLIYKYIFKK